MSALTELLGEKLVTKMGEDASKDEQVSTVEAFSGKKQIGLYFSAHWCPPCRGFTPKLAETYQTMKKAGKGLEIVFVSSDKDRAACKSYFDEQPWLCLPYDDRETKASLNKKFKVNGIPTLVLLDSDGNLISTKGRGFVSSDPKGESFPWVPPTLKSALTKVIDNEKKEVDTSTFAGKQVALYFSAHWCPPCRGFTPVLAKTYKQMRDKREDQNFEFVFISSDRDQKAFDEYFGTMPWHALPFSDRKAKQQLSEIFEVRGIPSLVVIDWDTGKVINKAARSACSNDPEGQEFPWYPKAVNDVNEETDGLNDEVCVIVLLDGASDGDKDQRSTDIEKVGKTYYEKAKAAGSDSKYRFFVEKKAGNVSSQIRKLCRVSTGVAKTIVLDLGDDGAYYNATSEGDVQQLIKDFEGGKLKKVKVDS